MVRECIGFTFMLLSLCIDFCFVRVAMICAILEKTSGFEFSVQKNSLKYLKLITFHLSHGHAELFIYLFWTDPGPEVINIFHAQLS